MNGRTKMMLMDLNPHIVCVLCGGYLIDATTIIECIHSFCRTCIMRYLESSKYCPICDVQVHKTKPLVNVRSDKTLQTLVYKLVPGLFKEEMRRRREYYAANPEIAKSIAPASVNSSEERGEVKDDDDISTKSDDEPISLCLEYCTSPPPYENGNSNNSVQSEHNDNCRYLLCPPDVTIGHIKKLLRMKYDLPRDYRLDVFYSDESLRDAYTLVDVTQIYTWRRTAPLKLFYIVYDETIAQLHLTPPSVKHLQQELQASSPGGRGKHNKKRKLTDEDCVTANVIISSGSETSDRDITSREDPDHMDNDSGVIVVSGGESELGIEEAAITVSGHSSGESVAGTSSTVVIIEDSNHVISEKDEPSGEPPEDTHLDSNAAELSGSTDLSTIEIIVVEAGDPNPRTSESPVELPEAEPHVSPNITINNNKNIVPLEESTSSSVLMPIDSLPNSKSIKPPKIPAKKRPTGGRRSKSVKIRNLNRPRTVRDSKSVKMRNLDRPRTVGDYLNWCKMEAAKQKDQKHCVMIVDSDTQDVTSSEYCSHPVTMQTNTATSVIECPASLSSSIDSVIRQFSSNVDNGFKQVTEVLELAQYPGSEGQNHGVHDYVISDPSSHHHTNPISQMGENNESKSHSMNTPLQQQGQFGSTPSADEEPPQKRLRLDIGTQSCNKTPLGVSQTNSLETQQPHTKYEVVRSS